MLKYVLLILTFILSSIFALILEKLIFKKKGSVIKRFLYYFIITACVTIFILLITNQLKEISNIVYLMILFSVCCFLFIFTNYKEYKSIKKSFFPYYLTIFFCCLSISFVFEIFIFNYQHMASLFNKEENIEVSSIGSSLEEVAPNTYKVVKDEIEGQYLEVTSLNKTITNIYVGMIAKQNLQQPFELQLSLKDEGNNQYYAVPERTIIPAIQTSQYLTLHASGKVDSIKFTLSLEEGSIVELPTLTINCQVPIFISFSRIILVTFILFVLFLIRPKSPLYQYPLVGKSKVKMIVMILFVLLEGWLFFSLTRLNFLFYNAPYVNQHQYEELAHSFKEGKVYIDKEVPNTLLEMENPYDTKDRTLRLQEAGEEILWDHAYYEGKYYVYFGVVPVLLFYYPYHMITGLDLSNQTVNFILCIFTMISMLLFLKEFMKKYFKNASFILYLLIATVLIQGCGLLYIAKRPDFYFVPIATSLWLTFLGLYFWLSAKKGQELSKIRLFIGSLSMALVAGCRPQFLVASFLFIPIFYDEIFKKRTLFSKKGFGNTLIIILAYLVVAIPLMYYNYVRFDSVFDFGANYNLTSNDMTKRGFVLGRLPLGIFSYLFYPVAYTNYFPFMNASNIETSYLGLTISEPFFGGLFKTSIFTLLSLVLFFIKRKFKKKNIWAIGILCLILGLLVICVDTEMSGILPRYVLDFSYLFYIAAIIFTLKVDEIIPKEKKHIFRTIILILIGCTLLYHFLFIFTDVSETLKEYNSTFFYQWFYNIQFWL